MLLAGDELAARFPGAAPQARLGVVDPTPRKLELAAQVVARGRSWHGRDDVWFSPAPLSGVAFLFPGLEAEFAPRVDDVAVLLNAEVPDLTTSSVGRHAAAVLGVSRLLDRAVRALGVLPDAVAGHSVGEWGAMIAGGMVDGADFDAMITGADLDALRVPGIEFAVVGCSVSRVEGLLTPNVVVSHENSTNQTVVCGPQDTVDELVARLRAGGVICQSLPFRSGFHTPMLAPYLDVFEAGVPSLPMRAATVPVWSATTARPFPDDPAAARELCVRHLVERVRFREVVLGLYESGMRVFVQMGPGQLGSLVGDTLRGEPHLVVAANSPHRPGIGALRRLATAVWVAGGDPDFTLVDRPPAQHTPVLSVVNGSVDSGAGGQLTADIVRLIGLGATMPAAAEFSALLAHTAASVTAVLTASDTTLEVSTTAMPYLLDHCLAEQRPGWPDEADRRPVVPGTTMVAHLTAAALRAAPGRVVTEVTDVRFHQWLEASPGQHVRIEVSHDTSLVRLGDYAEATVTLGDRYPTPDPWPPATGERMPTMLARQLYDERWLFHGPAFQGVKRTIAISDHTIRGQLTVLPPPGALLDAVGHLLGQWLIETRGEDYIAFPVRIDRIRWHAPEPDVGSTVDCAMRFSGNVRADARLSVYGHALATIEGWHDILFDAAGPVQAVHRHVAANTLSTKDGPGYRLPLDRIRGNAVRELCMRKYLGSAERAELDSRPLAEWIAIKDAVRGLLWERGAGPVFPAELRVQGNQVTGLHGRVVPALDIDVWTEDGDVIATAKEARQ